jgi:hypothetical protein
MRYFITGMDVAKGVEEDDVSDEKPYYELGWEVVTTHFDIKRMKRRGEVDPDADTIVTCAGREFLYTAEFSRVIDHGAFLRIKTEGDEVVDCTDRYAGGRVPIQYFEGDAHTPMSRYKYFDEDRDMITRVGAAPTAHLHGGRPYACLLVRRRSHGAYRNMSDERVSYLLEKLMGKYERVFLVGRGAEHLEDRSRAVHVDLQTYASLIQDELCEVIIGSFTGTMQLAALLSRAKTCLVLNHDLYDVQALNHPVLLGRCVTFSPSRFFFIPPDHLEAFFEICAL